MPSFDIVSEVDSQELTNALDQANREIANRYDFKGSSAKIERQDNTISLYADSEFQLGQVRDILYLKAAKRSIDVASFNPGKIETISGDKARQTLSVKQGIEKELGKQIVKHIKDSKLKVQPAIEGGKVRVSGKKRDDLQAIIAALRKNKFEQPLQYVNFRD